MDLKAKIYQKKVDIDTLDLKAGNITKDKNRHVIINRSIIKENIAILCKHPIILP